MGKKHVISIELYMKSDPFVRLRGK